MKLHTEIKHNEKMRCAQELGPYTRSQCRNQVFGQIVP